MKSKREEVEMGKLFVIDGTDGSGKQTQFNKLKERFDKEGVEYRVASFPNYDHISSSLVKMYLSGEFGQNAKDVSPYIASTFYAADRYATYKTTLEEFYKAGGIVLVDRYTTSNMIHQAGKIQDKEEREKFLNWLWDFEFNLYGIPVPTKTFFLNMPTETAIKLMEERENKFTHTQAKDIHERDAEHLKDSYNAAVSLVDKYDWTEIKCVTQERLKTIDEIHEEIWTEIKKYI